MAVVFVQCRKDRFLEDSSAKLAFSTDTLTFDTVFTTVGSTTQSFRIRNPHNQKIKISNISLKGGATSVFRLNVDGIPGIDFDDVEIPAGDSLFVFVEVTLDPNGQDLPLVVEDAVQFSTNGNAQEVLLQAWGQDAYFHFNEVIPSNTVWQNNKPHVVIGFVAVDSAVQLTIPKNTQIHMHANSTFLVFKGSLIVQGERDEPVVWQGDRLEEFYDDVAGQWRRIHLFLPQDCDINYAIIKNGAIGLQIDSVTDDGSSMNGVTIRNSQIFNHTAASLFCQGAKVNAENVVMGSAGQFSAALTIGGEYNFLHCTIANYSTGGNRQDPGFVLSNYFEDVFNNINIRQITNTRFDNCIFYGNTNEEFVVDIRDNANQNYLFNHCVVRTERDVIGPNFNSIFKNFDPGFIEPPVEDYRLIEGAYAQDRGDPANTNALDLLMHARDSEPDLGAYEIE